MKERLDEIRKKALELLEEAEGKEKIQDVKVKFLGKKGELTSVLKAMGSLSPEERPVVGNMANEVRKAIFAAIEEKEGDMQKRLMEKKLAEETIDVTLPGRKLEQGSIHVVTRVIREISDIFIGLGFSVAEGPEIESDYYNFEALNLPKDHPARDMQDSFYITPEVLLRTHTSPVQVRSMLSRTDGNSLKVICPGKVYRRDDDATHSPMFHQIEGLAVGENIRMSDLKGVLLEFAKQMFGPEQKVRLRPSYFPFTEPSTEVDISCVMCGGKGCRVCSHTGWIEILGAGMVHPNVLSYGKYDASQVTGFAFGMGVERVAMLKYGINDLRLMFENDVRFLKQF